LLKSLEQARQQERVSNESEAAAADGVLAPIESETGSETRLPPTAAERSGAHPAAASEAPFADAPAPGAAFPDSFRLANVEQRVWLLSERVELLAERVRAARPRRAVNSNHSARAVTSSNERELTALLDRVSKLEASARFTERASNVHQSSEPLGVVEHRPVECPPVTDKPSAVEAAKNEGTLRPPRVPQGLDLGAMPRPVSGITERPARNTARLPAGPLLSGSISGLSLGSLFSLLEFERSSGSLSVHNDERRLDLIVKDGQVVRSELDGIRTSASSALREALTWRVSTFSFHRDNSEDDAEPPQSVNALMLEALRFQDEELRMG
jgi:hypothetical protein